MSSTMSQGRPHEIELELERVRRKRAQVETMVAAGGPSSFSFNLLKAKHAKESCAAMHRNLLIKQQLDSLSSLVSATTTSADALLKRTQFKVSRQSYLSKAAQRQELDAKLYVEHMLTAQAEWEAMHQETLRLQEALRERQAVAHSLQNSPARYSPPALHRQHHSVPATGVVSPTISSPTHHHHGFPSPFAASQVDVLQPQLSQTQLPPAHPPTAMPPAPSWQLLMLPDGRTACVPTSPVHPPLSLHPQAAQHTLYMTLPSGPVGMHLPTPALSQHAFEPASFGVAQHAPQLVANGSAGYPLQPQITLNPGTAGMAADPGSSTVPTGTIQASSSQQQDSDLQLSVPDTGSPTHSLIQQPAGLPAPEQAAIGQSGGEGVAQQDPSSPGIRLMAPSHMADDEAGGISSPWSPAIRWRTRVTDDDAVSIGSTIQRPRANTAGEQADGAPTRRTTLDLVQSEDSSQQDDTQSPRSFPDSPLVIRERSPGGRASGAAGSSRFASSSLGEMSSQDRSSGQTVAMLGASMSSDVTDGADDDGPGLLERHASITAGVLAASGHVKLGAGPSINELHTANQRYIQHQDSLNKTGDSVVMAAEMASACEALWPNSKGSKDGSSERESSRDSESAQHEVVRAQPEQKGPSHKADGSLNSASEAPRSSTDGKAVSTDAVDAKPSSDVQLAALEALGQAGSPSTAPRVASKPMRKSMTPAAAGKPLGLPPHVTHLNTGEHSNRSSESGIDSGITILSSPRAPSCISAGQPSALDTQQSILADSLQQSDSSSSDDSFAIVDEVAEGLERNALLCEHASASFTTKNASGPPAAVRLGSLVVDLNTAAPACTSNASSFTDKNRRGSRGHVSFHNSRDNSSAGGASGSASPNRRKSATSLTPVLSDSGTISGGGASLGVTRSAASISGPSSSRPQPQDRPLSKAYSVAVPKSRSMGVGAYGGVVCELQQEHGVQIQSSRSMGAAAGSSSSLAVRRILTKVISGHSEFEEQDSDDGDEEQEEVEGVQDVSSTRTSPSGVDAMQLRARQMGEQSIARVITPVRDLAAGQADKHKHKGLSGLLGKMKSWTSNTNATVPAPSRGSAGSKAQLPAMTGHHAQRSGGGGGGGAPDLHTSGGSSKTGRGMDQTVSSSFDTDF